MTELRNDLIIYFWIMVGVALVGFAGWITMEPEPIQYQIRKIETGATKGVRI